MPSWVLPSLKFCGAVFHHQMALSPSLSRGIKPALTPTWWVIEYVYYTASKFLYRSLFSSVHFYFLDLIYYVYFLKEVYYFNHTEVRFFFHYFIKIFISKVLEFLIFRFTTIIKYVFNCLICNVIIALRYLQVLWNEIIPKCYAFYKYSCNSIKCMH